MSPEWHSSFLTKTEKRSQAPILFRSTLACNFKSVTNKCYLQLSPLFYFFDCIQFLIDRALTRKSGRLLTGKSSFTFLFIIKSFKLTENPGRLSFWKIRFSILKTHAIFFKIRSLSPNYTRMSFFEKSKSF